MILSGVIGDFMTKEEKKGDKPIANLKAGRFQLAVWDYDGKSKRPNCVLSRHTKDKGKEEWNIPTKMRMYENDVIKLVELADKIKEEFPDWFKEKKEEEK